MSRSPTHILSGCLLLVLMLALGIAHSAPAGAQAQQAMKPKLEGAELVAALVQGGHVILMRHALTERVTPVPAEAVVGDCSTQRNLSDVGRRQAQQIGEAVRKLGIRVGEVFSSPYCRCVETAKLAFGKVKPSDVLSVGASLDYTAKADRGAAVRKMLDTPPAESGTNTVLITHTGTLLYSFGLSTRPEGVAHIFRPVVVGPAVYVGTFEPEDWPRLAGMDPRAAAAPGAD